MEKILIKTFGCSLNYADSERIKAKLKQKGFNFTDDEDDADLIIINSCAVKGPTEAKFFTLLNKLREKGKNVVVAGCIAQAMPEKLHNVSIIGPDNISSIARIVDETLSGNVVSMIVQQHTNKLAVPAIRRKNILEIIPISQGCVGECSYCIVKRARGELHSYPTEDIVNAVRKAVEEGVKEIWLTSQDNGCYGFDTGTDLPTLINKVAGIDGDFKIRIGMMNPNHVLRMLKKLVEAYKHEKVYKFLHIPLQSGNNFVLDDMNRKYHVEDFTHIINMFRKEIPEITISTDIIVGYPTEKDEFFKDSLKLIKDIEPSVLNLSRYWPRDGTSAFRLKQLPGKKTKERAVEIMQAFSWISFNSNKKWIGWEGRILITEKGKDHPQLGTSYVGRNYCYKTVVVFGEFEIGKYYKVKIQKASKHDLYGKVLQ